jgi:hypothetical protein
MLPLRLPFLDAELLLTPPWSHLGPALQWLLLALVVVAPLALLVWLYRYELKLVPARTATALLGLRLGVLVLLLFLVCLQPIYARNITRELPGRVLIAVDRSDSMDVADPQREPAEKLRLAKALNLARDLCDDARLDSWAAAHEAGTEPQWVAADEEREDGAKRQELAAKRRKTHDEVVARVDALTRAEAARRVLGEEGVGLLAAVQGRHEVDLLGFHRDSWDVKPEKGPLSAADLAELFRKPEAAAAKEPDATAAFRGANASAFTDLRVPLLRALERSGPGQGKVLGVVLLTDGQHNSGEPPSKKAQELGERKVPVYPVALGARRPPPDVAVVSVRGPNHTVFKDVDAEVAVRFKVSGLKGQDLIVQLHRTGKEKKLLAERTVKHDGKDRLYDERFAVRLDEAGTQTLVATVRPLNPDVKETRADNNSLATTVSVADDKARVLLIDGEARWEFHYLATALQRDRTMDVTSVVFNQPRLDERLTQEELEKMGSPRQELPKGPDALSGFQCVILGDVEAARLPLAERLRLERYVADAGGTLVILAGKRFMPLAYPEAGPGGEADPLRKLLPVESPRAFAPEDGFALTLAQGGREMKFMELDPDKEENEELWAGRPRPWAWAVAGRAKPGATPLAYVAAAEDEKLPPGERERRRAVLVRHNYGFGRVLFVGLDSTWRWRYKTGDQYHHRFWGQAIRWAAADKPLVVGNAYHRFGTPQPVYRAGEAVEVVVRFSEAMGPVKPDLLAGARVLRLPDRPGEREQAVALVPLGRRPAQPRVLEGKLRDLPAGRYAAELAVPDLADRLRGEGGKPLRAEFTVLPPESNEMVDLETRWPLLGELAVKSGGRVFTPEDAAELVRLLAGQSVPHVEHREQRVYQWWLMLALVVGLLSLEWVGRKLAGLP